MTEELRNRIMDLAEDDFTGLWEYVWGLESETGNPGTARTQLQPVVLSMLLDRSLKLFHGRSFDGDETEVAPEAAVSLLNEDRTWQPPKLGQEHYRVAADLSS